MTFPQNSCNISCMGKPRTIPEDKLQLKDAPALIWIKVSTALKYLWDENPKLHNIGDLVESIKKHGFQEVPRFDKHIGIKAGNGRVEALAWMEKDGGYDLPRGLAKIRDSGEWVMPLLVGTDAESVNLARSYAIDSNNIAMSGGNLTDHDMARQYEKTAYMDVLRSIAAEDDEDVMPVTVPLDVLDHLSRKPPREETESFESLPEHDENVKVEYRCPSCGFEWGGTSIE